MRIMRIMRIDWAPPVPVHYTYRNPTCSTMGRDVARVSRIHRSLLHIGLFCHVHRSLLPYMYIATRMCSLTIECVLWAEMLRVCRVYDAVFGAQLECVLLL